MHIINAGLRNGKSVVSNRQLVAAERQGLLCGCRTVDGEVHRHYAVAAVHGLESLGIVARLSIGVVAPHIAVAGHGIKLGGLAVVNGQMQRHYAVAAVHRIESLGIVARLGIGVVDPRIAVADSFAERGVEDGEHLGRDGNLLAFAAALHVVPANEVSSGVRSVLNDEVVSGMHQLFVQVPAAFHIVAPRACAQCQRAGAADAVRLGERCRERGGNEYIHSC